MTAIHFPFNLQKYRKARNLSQEDLAEKLQVSRQAVAKWEKGANYPDILNLTLLASIVPNSGQKWLYRKSDYPEYFKESQ